MPDILREAIRDAITKGASGHRITKHIVDWCRVDCPSHAIRGAATTQVSAVLKLSNANADALVSEYFV